MRRGPAPPYRPTMTPAGGRSGGPPATDTTRHRGTTMRLTSRLRTLTGVAALVVPLGLAGAAPPAGAATSPSQWPQFGQSARHLNTNPAEQTFTVGNVEIGRASCRERAEVAVGG